MIDLGKVIKGLEMHVKKGNGVGCLECPYADEEGGTDDWCLHGLHRDILALLKEQEAKTVESIQMDRSDKWGADLTGYCPSCKRPLKSQFNQRFCGKCGQAVKWG